MNIVLCGLMFSENSLREAQFYSKTGIQMAPHLFQSNLLAGLKQLGGDVRVSAVNVTPIGSFPMHYRRLAVRRELWDDGNVQIGYWNLPIVKQIRHMRAAVRELEKKLDLEHPEQNFIITYNTYEPFVRAACHLKKKHPGIRLAMLVTDCIPGRGDMERYMTASAVRKGDRIIKMAKNYDGFIFLTKYLAEALEIGDKPYVITECISNEKQSACPENAVSANRCLYSGAVNAEYGICELADAFAGMDGAELWICGKGNAGAYLEKLAAKHENIRYLGFLNPKELENYRSQCDFLINPRRPSGTYTKYSFPSKTAEYMMAAKPVIMYKLEGIPDEYDQYLNYLTGKNVWQIRRELAEIFASDYEILKQKAAAGRGFMMREKSSLAQAKRIFSLYQQFTKR